MKFTHKGWFGICPVYMTDPKTGCPDVAARHKYLEPLFTLSEVVYDGIIYVKSYFNDVYEPEWPFTVTGEGSFYLDDLDD